MSTPDPTDVTEFLESLDQDTLARYANEQLRNGLAAEKERRIAAESRSLSTDIRDIGLDPSEGLGLAIAEGFDGDLSVEGAVATFATDKYKHSHTAPEVAQSPVAEQVAQSQEAVDAMATQSQATEGITAIDQMAAHDELLATEEATSGDAVASINAKMNQFTQEHYPT